MNTQRIAIALTALNLVLLSCAAVQSQSRTPELRAAAFVLVDESGVVRARLGLKGSDTAELDLFDRTGAIRIKLSAAQSGSGLVLGDETGQVGIHLLSRSQPLADWPATTHITLKGAAGKEHIIRP
jgi:hypothetical protein